MGMEFEASVRASRAGNLRHDPSNGSCPWNDPESEMTIWAGVYKCTCPPPKPKFRTIRPVPQSRHARLSCRPLMEFQIVDMFQQRRRHRQYMAYIDGYGRRLKETSEGLRKMFAKFKPQTGRNEDEDVLHNAKAQRD